MKTLLYCNCSQANLTPESSRQAVLNALHEAGVEYLYTDDLCGLCADKRFDLPKSLGDGGLVVMACFVRTVHALLERAGLTDIASPTILNLRTASPETIADELNLDGVRPGGRIVMAHSIADWQPWYPLIDSDRCKQCKQCLNFCLFGVYALDAENKVRVTEPTHCKAGCPACARVCPFAAIVFPKYTAAPINGDAVDEQAWKSSPPPADLQQRLRGNVMQMLRNRTATGPADTLERLKKDLDIPDSVIENLKNE